MNYSCEVTQVETNENGRVAWRWDEDDGSGSEEICPVLFGMKRREFAAFMAPRLEWRKFDSAAVSIPRYG